MTYEPEMDLGYYLHNNGITDLMDPIGEYTLINELMPPQSEPLPSDSNQKTFKSDISLTVE